MRNKLRLSVVDGFVVSVLVASMILKFIGLGRWIAMDNVNSFALTEFLINFEGGYVRRGLLGQLLFGLSSSTGIYVGWLIYGICFGAYLFVTAFFFRAFLKKRYCWWLILSPFLCGMIFSLVRKDYLCYALIIAQIYLVRDGVRSNARCWAAAMVAVMGIMLHEAYIFFGVPVFALMTLRSRLGPARLLPLAFICGCFLLQCVFKGDSETAMSIISSWNGILPGQPLTFMEANSIGALAWDTADTFKMHFMSNFHQDTLGWLTIVWRLLFYVVSYYFITNFIYVMTGKTESAAADRDNISALYLFSTLCLLPMFLVLSCDNGRIYQYAWMATFIVFLIVPRDTVAGLFGQRIMNIAHRINSFSDRLVKPSRAIMIVLLLCFAEGRTVPSPMAELYCSPIGRIIYDLTPLNHPYQGLHDTMDALPNLYKV